MDTNFQGQEWDELRKEYFNRPEVLMLQSIVKKDENGILFALKLAKTLKRNLFNVESWNNDSLRPGVEFLLSNCSTKELIAVIKNLHLYELKKVDNLSKSSLTNQDQKILYLLIENGLGISTLANYIFEIKTQNSNDFIRIVESLLRHNFLSLYTIRKESFIKRILFETAKSDKSTFLKKILLHGFRYQDLNHDSINVALILAVKSLKPKNVSILIDNKANVNYKNGLALNELLTMFISKKSDEFKQLEIINLLLESGVDVNQSYDAYSINSEKIKSKQVAELIEKFITKNNLYSGKSKDESYTIHFDLNTIITIPFFKEALSSNFFDFNIQSYLEYLNRGFDKDKTELTRLLIQETLNNTGNVTYSTIFLNLAMGLHDWFVPNLEEYDENTGLVNLVQWTNLNCNEFYSKLCLLDKYENLKTGDHLYYVNKLLTASLPDVTKQAMCLGLYHLIQSCLNNLNEDIETDIDLFPDILLFRKTLHAELSVVFNDSDVAIVGLLNKFGKYEFYKATESITISNALSCGLLTEDICEEIFKLEYDDYFDTTVIVYENKIIPDSYDGFKLIKKYIYDEEVYFLLLNKSNVWYVFKITMSDEYDENYRIVDIEVNQLDELRGLKLSTIKNEIDKIDENDDDEVYNGYSGAF